MSAAGPRVVVPFAELGGRYADDVRIVQDGSTMTIDFLAHDPFAEPPGRAVVVARLRLPFVTAQQLYDSIDRTFGGYYRSSARPG